MIGRSIKSRRRVFRYQSILSHLKIVTATISSLVEEQQKLFSGKFSLSENAVEQAAILFTQQEMILCTLEESIKTGEEMHLRAVCSACNEFIRICRQSANEHEKRVEKGLCLPVSAPHFLTILDGMRSLVHHEQEIVKLLVRWKRTKNRFP
jgi:Na+/phosphate symporter